MFSSIARIIKPHGVRGELKVLPIKDDFSGFILQQSQFQVLNNIYQVNAIRSYKQGFIVKLDGVNDMEKAEELRNKEIQVNTDDFKMFLDQNEIFVPEEWLGYIVKDEHNVKVGIVEDIIYTGANDVLVVKAKEEVLVPVVNDYIVSVEPDNKLIKIIMPKYFNE